MSITRINTNYEALIARNNIRKMEMSTGKSMARISSGLRIVTAADDPSSIAILTTETAQMRGSRVAQQNIQESYQIIKYTDAMMDSIENVLIEMRNLAIRQSNDATLSTTQQNAIDDEYQILFDSIDAAAMTDATWNTIEVMQGGLGNVYIQYGANSGMNMQLTSATWTTDTDATTLAVQATCTTANAGTAITLIDTALDSLGGKRSEVGYTMRLLEIQLRSQQTTEVSHAAAVATIGDADMAAEISNVAKNQIIAQAAMAMLGQANMMPQSILQLLG